MLRKISLLACLALTGSLTTAAPSVHVSGVLVSPGQRLAIVNGQISRVGEHVDGVEIVAIDMRGVRMRAGSQELMAYVGASAFPAPDAATLTAVAADTRVERTAAASGDALGPAEPGAASARAGPTLTSYGPVARGETLSEIAAALRRDGITSNQLMTALFRANPSAFGNNINLLREGSTLEIPPLEALLEISAAAATDEVARHARIWAARADAVVVQAAPPDRYGPGKNQPPNRHGPEQPAPPDRYGPVKAGETLSQIAQRLAPAGITLEQMMLAVFEANPNAFSSNINKLRAGVSLDVPAGQRLASRSPEQATAEVQRQAAAWRAGQALKARSASTCLARPTVGPCAPAGDPPERVPIQARTG